jgi:7-cyano-7-deazaguanine reductase
MNLVRIALNMAVPPLETFKNSHPGRDYTIIHTCPEFTALCPKTGQPDFATIRVSYVPDRDCVELKSLKLYLQGYRDRGIFYEHVVNAILDDLVAATKPRRMTVEGEFNVRGGIGSVVRATYEKRRKVPNRR